MDLLIQDAKLAAELLGEAVNEFEGKSICITGASGFLGTHLSRFFTYLNDDILSGSCQLFLLDNLIRETSDDFSPLLQRSDVVFEKFDVAKRSDFPVCDYYIHAASIASPIVYRKYPLETMDTNVRGTRHLLDFARENAPKAILHISSSEIYGNPPAEAIPTAEEFPGLVSATGARSCYDESKRYAETLCVYFQKLYNVPVRVVRPFNVYGPGLKADDGRVMSDFFSDGIESGGIRLYSDGRATRSFCYIADALNGFLRVLLNGRDGQAYNIGNPDPEITIRELAERVAAIMDLKHGVRYEKSEDEQYNEDNPERRCPSIRKAQEELGFRPVINLDTGIARSLEYYKEIL